MLFFKARPLSAIVLLVWMALANAACHKKRATVPVPSQPESAPAAAAPAPKKPVASPKQPPTPAPVAAAPAPAPAPQPKDETVYQKNKPPDQPPPPKHVARPSNPAPVAAPSPAPTTPPPADSPRLGDVLTAEQQHEYNAAIDQSLANAQNSLASLTNRQLGKEQEATVEQVKNFMQQAQASRKDDLAAAKSLAERADVLAHDLVASLK